MQKTLSHLTAGARCMLLWAAAWLLLACSSTQVPMGITPVTPFDANRYLGPWYEIARLDHSFERGLSNITAHYSLNPDGSIRVVNRGFSTIKQKWQEATGKAKFVANKNSAHLKVSFFGPFYGSYIVFALDQGDYQYALITGPNRDYFWLLARTPQLDETRKRELLAKATRAGFDVNQLIWVDHSRASTLVDTPLPPPTTPSP